MMRTLARLRNFKANRAGATMVEHALVFAMLITLSFGLVEFGVVLYQYNSAEAATSAGARFIATRGPVVAGLSDCGVSASGVSAGTRCSAVPGASSWTITCDASAPGGSCQGAVLNELVAEMRRFAPNVQAQNVQVVLRGAGLGFVGRGSPVPMVTVRLNNMRYDFIALDDLLGFGALTMPGFDATLVGEDFNGAGA